jgi:hypothetical protein
MPDADQNSARPKKKKGINAKIVKHAHRRRFQEYLRTKGRDKSTIGYVYWSMFLRSGAGNVFELEESLFLADLGIGKNAVRPARKTLVDDGWLSTGQQKVNPLTGKWGTTAWTVNTESVALSMGDGTVAPLAGDRSVGDTVVLHLLDASNPEASTSSCTPLASTRSGDFSVSRSFSRGTGVPLAENQDSGTPSQEGSTPEFVSEEEKQRQEQINVLADRIGCRTDILRRSARPTSTTVTCLT